MADYLTEGLQTNADEILEGMIADYQARMPDWVPYGAAPEVQLMAIIAFRHAVTLDVASQVLTGIYRNYGLTLAGVPPIIAEAATATATFTMRDTAGYTIPDNLPVDIHTSGNTTVPFLVDSTVTVAPGNLTATVALIAAQPGAAASGITGSVTDAAGLDFIHSIVLTGPTTGGQDGQTDTEYLATLTRRLRRLSDKIITPQDAETALLDDIPGIGRVLILDNYIPAIGGNPAQTNVAGAFTAVVTDPAGANVTGGIATAAEALIEARRILQIDAYIANPVRTNVTVAYTGVAYTGFDPVDLQTRANDAVTEFMSAAQWGQTAVSSDGPIWVDQTVVRFGELYAVLNGVTGMNYVTDVKINGVSNADFTLTGPGALPTLTSVSGTVT